MGPPEAHLSTFGLGFAAGALTLFVVTVGLLRLAGVEGWIVPVLGILVGLFVGGTAGALVAMRHEQSGQG
jgi:hypothetical protein